MRNFLLSWKTTVLGIVAAVMIGLGPFAVPGADFTWKNIALAIVIAAWGAVSKDYNVKINRP